MQLTGLLKRLPDAPVASNFTARVLDAVDRADRSGIRRARLWVRLGFHRPAFRFAAAAALMLAGGFSYHQYRVSSRENMALSVAAMADAVNASAEAAPIPAVEMLKDFEAIYRLGQTRPQADEALLDALAMK
jgi:hypothetical protein